MDDALNRGLHQLNADQQHERRHDQTREILVAAMSVRMLGVGGLARQLKAQHAHDIRAGIGQVVHGIRHNRNRSRQHTNCALRSTKRNISENTHHARQRAHARTVALRTTNDPLDHLHQPPRYCLYISIAQTDCSVATLSFRYKKAATHTGHGLGAWQRNRPFVTQVYALASAALATVSGESASSSATCPFVGTTPKQ